MAEFFEGVQEIARILRVDRDDVLIPASDRLEKATGKMKVLDGLAETKEQLTLEKLEVLGVGRDAAASEVYDALIAKIEADDHALFELLRRPDYLDPASYKTILGFAREASRVGEGFFITSQRAEEFLRNEPPRKTMEVLGYKTIGELLKNENLLEVYSSIRFIEDREWLNNVFFKQYETLRISDFERRPVEMRVLSPKWRSAAEKFLQKKHHNVSHLKELGVIFVIPWSLGVAGETLRLMSMLLHYTHELEFYARIFERFSRVPETFTYNFIAALRGDVPLKRPRDIDIWLIVQRYMAKEDEFDWRLFWPHVNPEALHWKKAEEDIARVGTHFNVPGLLFWHETDWLGDYFKTESGIDVLVSFDLVDVVMSLVKRQQFHKYLYHQQEAMWNKLFSSYVGDEMMWRLVEEHFQDHQILVSKITFALRGIRK